MDVINTDKYVLTEEELTKYNIWNDYQVLRSQLYRADEREDCVLIQGSAFVVKGKAFLVVGVGGIHFLDSLAQMEGVDGIIGNGNTIFLSKDFKHVYSAHSEAELVERYQYEGTSAKRKFLDEAPLAPVVFLLRTFRNDEDYINTKKKITSIVYEKLGTVAASPVRYSGKIKARLRSKFVKTTRICHMAYRPILYRKETLFDSEENVRKTIDSFEGHFVLMYMKWNQAISDGFGVGKVRKLANNVTYNPTDPITPHWLKIAMSTV